MGVVLVVDVGVVLVVTVGVVLTMRDISSSSSSSTTNLCMGILLLLSATTGSASSINSPSSVSLEAGPVNIVIDNKLIILITRSSGLLCTDISRSLYWFSCTFQSWFSPSSSAICSPSTVYNQHQLLI